MKNRVRVKLKFQRVRGCAQRVGNYACNAQPVAFMDDANNRLVFFCDVHAGNLRTYRRSLRVGQLK